MDWWAWLLVGLGILPVLGLIGLILVSIFVDAKEYPYG